jgi:hypothetical protein
VQSGEAAVHNTSSAGADIRISQQDRPQFRLIETLTRPIATGDGDEHRRAAVFESARTLP